MSTLFKWLLFIALTGGYIWMVFFGFTKTNEVAAVEPPSMEDVPETPVPSQAEYDSTDEWELEEPVEVTDEEDHYEAFGETQDFLLIYGSYLDKKRAQAAIDQLGFDCPNCEVVFIEPYYKLVLERSATKEEAKAHQRRYKELGAAGFIQKI